MPDEESVSKLIFVGLETADGILTMWATNHGFQEVNPLMAPIASSWVFLASKIVVVVLSLGILIVIGRRFPRSVNVALNITSFFLLAVIASNLFEMVKWG